jgi:tetratricopeptide (TPR) repeat protein
MANDWCKKKTWSEADKADFYKCLSCKEDKAKFLSIQAAIFESVGTPELLRAAISLLDGLIAEFVNDTTFTHPRGLPAAYNRKAACYLRLGDVEMAIADYYRVFAYEKDLGDPITLACFDFGRLVAEQCLRDHFDEAIAALERYTKSSSMHLPADIFTVAGIRALVAFHKGDIAKAKEFAQIAMAAAARDISGIRYHPNFGLVKDRGSKFFASIEAVAARDIQSFSN